QRCRSNRRARTDQWPTACVSIDVAAAAATRLEYTIAQRPVSTPADRGGRTRFRHPGLGGFRWELDKSADEYIGWRLHEFTGCAGDKLEPALLPRNEVAMNSPDH